MTLNLFGRKLFLFGIFVCLLVMFATSVSYRINHPNLTVRSRKQAAPEGMGNGMGMGAIQQMMSKVQSEPKNVQNLVDLGNAFLMMRAWDKALEFLDRARAVEPDNVVVLKSVGICYFQKKQYEEAVEVYEHIVDIEPNDSLAHYNLGIIFNHFLNDSVSAKVHFEKVLDLSGTDPEMKKHAKNELDAIGP